MNVGMHETNGTIAIHMIHIYAIELVLFANNIYIPSICTRHLQYKANAIGFYILLRKFMTSLTYLN